MNKQLRPLVFGEVLFDCFPDGRRVLGGAPFNVAWNLQAFGLNPLLISRVGNDALGKEIQAAMIDWDMDISGLQIDNIHPTGTVKVSIENNEPAYDIVKPCAWDFIEYDENLKQFPLSLIYHGSLAVRNHTADTTLKKIKNGSSVPVFIDVNLRPPWWDRQAILDLITQCQILKINEDELSLIVIEKNGLDNKIQHLLDTTNIDSLILTCGSKGAIAALPAGKRQQISPKEAVEVVDTVGAGDAFSSVILLGQLKHWPLALSMQRAQEFASKVVGIQGATTINKAFYQSLYKNWS